MAEMLISELVDPVTRWGIAVGYLTLAGLLLWWSRGTTVEVRPLRYYAAAFCVGWGLFYTTLAALNPAAGEIPSWLPPLSRVLHLPIWGFLVLWVWKSDEMMTRLGQQPRRTMTWRRSKGR